MIELFRYATLFRTLWLAGRFGGGKTALAVHLAIEICKHDHAENIVSNIKFIGLGEPTAILQQSDLFDLQDTVMLLDESWLMLGQGTGNKQVQSWLAYLRKSNLYLLLPSVMPLARQVSHLVVERQLSLMPLGLPLWVYKWRLTTGSMTKREQQLGRFAWPFPGRIFDMYDHNERPGEDYYYYASTSQTESDAEEIGDREQGQS